MTSDEQLTLWISGKSVHNDKGECCPDFSCCNPKLLAPKEVRETFAAAERSGNKKVVDRMLMEFLGRLLAGENVHIAGLEASKQEIE